MIQLWSWWIWEGSFILYLIQYWVGSYSFHKLMITNLCKYLWCFLVDFSKPFDPVEHIILIRKDKLTCYIRLHWQIDVLQSEINAFLLPFQHVQSYTVRTTLFIIHIIDLKLISHSNHMAKYADDRNLLVLERIDADICLECQHILKSNKWTRDNKLAESETKEIVFHWPSPRNFLSPV